jgi:hypothetical protein
VVSVAVITSPPASSLLFSFSAQQGPPLPRPVGGGEQDPPAPKMATNQPYHNARALKRTTGFLPRYGAIASGLSPPPLITPAGRTVCVRARVTRVAEYGSSRGACGPRAADARKRTSAWAERVRQDPSRRHGSRTPGWQDARAPGLCHWFREN